MFRMNLQHNDLIFLDHLALFLFLCLFNVLLLVYSLFISIYCRLFVSLYLYLEDIFLVAPLSLRLSLRI